MSALLQPWQLLFAILSGWVQRRQQAIIEFQNSQIISLMDALGKKRLLLTDDQRRLLAVKGKSLGRKTLQELTRRTRNCPLIAKSPCIFSVNREIAAEAGLPETACTTAFHNADYGVLRSVLLRDSTLA